MGVGPSAVLRVSHWDHQEADVVISKNCIRAQTQFSFDLKDHPILCFQDLIANDYKN